jgi:hypothetical protein
LRQLNRLAHPGFLEKYGDAAHTLFGQDWLTTNGAPNGFNRAQLQADPGNIK